MAIYAQACSKLEGVQIKMDALDADKRQHGLSSDGDLNALARWQRWAEIEIGKLRSQHTEAAKGKEVARQVAVKSVAKVQALEILLKKALKEDVLIKRRRAEQNGQPPDA
jgi:hypothetical protein